MVFPDAQVKEIILGLEADLNLYPAGFVMRLYTNNVTPTPQTVLGDLTQALNADIPGYAAVAITWDGTPSRSPDGSWIDYGTDAPFIATGAGSGANTVYGWYLTDAANTVLLGAQLLPAPFTFTLPGDGFRVEPSIKAEQTSDVDVNLTFDGALS
jgi:hypothetical protein